MHIFANLGLNFYIQESKFYIFDKYIYSFIATTYPSEILEKRLYLGDHIQA